MSHIGKKEKITKYSMLAICLLIVAVLIIVFWDPLVEKISMNFIETNNYLTILKGLKNTFLITIVGFILGLILGIVTCLILGSQSQNTFILILKQVFKFYVQLFRGTPSAVQLLIIYYIVFMSFTGDPIYIAMLAFGLNSGAYVSEIIRGGINAVPKGQMEAGRSLGLPYGTVMGKIIFPQAIRNSLPSLGNEFITLIKETSIAGFIGASDLTQVFRKIATGTYDYVTVYLVMGVAYFVIVYLITILFNILEKRLLKND